MSETALIIYNARWMDQKEPENYGYFATLESAQKACQEHSRKPLKWGQTKNSMWYSGDGFQIFPITVQP